MKCKLTVLITSFVCALAIIINPLTAFAADSGGSTQMWNGDLFFHDQGFTIPLFNVFANSEMITEDNDVLGKYKVASFSGSASNLLQVNGTVGTYLNGVATTTYTFTADGDYEGVVSAQLTSGQYDGLILSSLQQRVDNNLVVVKVFVTFNNFEITSSTMYFPIQFDVSYSSRYDEVFMNIPYAVAVLAQGSDWTDQIAMYTSLEDLPGSKGILGSIIGHISTWFNNLMDRDLVNHKDLKNHITTETKNITDSLDTNRSYIVSRIAQSTQELLNNDKTLNDAQIANDNANSQAEIEQSKQNTTTLTEGFDNITANRLQNDMSDGASILNTQEQVSYALAGQSLQGFTLINEPTEDALGAFQFLGTFMQAIFESSLGFGFIATSAFSLTIIRMIAGFTKFMG